MKSVKSAINDSAAGDGWFKIWDEGYDEKEEKWCTNKMIDNGGRMSVKVPTELAGGYYLVRPEFVALHAADKGDPQFYTGCAQIFLKSSGNAKPSKTVSIPGFVDKDTPGLTFNIWETPMALPYPIPGPEVAELVGTDSVSANTVQTQTEGETPSGDACILENANWCGKEVPSYSDEAGCWASQSNCWDQGDVCYHPYGGDLGPTTGSAGCDKWQDYCQSLEDLCNAGNFNGPPNNGKSLMSKVSTIDPPAPEPTSGGGFVAASVADDASAEATTTSEAPAPKPTTSKASTTSQAPAPESTTSKSTSSKAAAPASGSGSGSSSPAETSDLRDYNNDNGGWNPWVRPTATAAAELTTSTDAAGNVVTVVQTDVVTQYVTMTAADAEKHKRDHVKDFVAKRHVKRAVS